MTDRVPENDQRNSEGGTRPPEPGLHFVSVPIGNARDITLRALDVLRDADVLAAEDTRSLRRLLEIHGVPLNGRRIHAYHDANGPKARPALLAALGEGKSVAYASEAGTPLVADPGYVLARAAAEAGHKVTCAPGASALTAALAVAAMPSDRVLFAGFPPPSAGERRRWIEGLDAAGATVVLYESPRRVRDLLGELRDALGEGRPAALCRELTKRFEEVRRGTLGSVAEGLDADPKGEIVLLIGRAEAKEADAAEVEAMLSAALARLSVKDAVREVMEASGMKRREVYAMALRLEGEGR